MKDISDVIHGNVIEIYKDYRGYQGRIQGGQRGLLTLPSPPPQKIFFSVPRSRYSNRAVTLIKQSQY